MTSQVLIAYSSRHGSTSEIAQEIADTIEKEDTLVDLVDLRERSNWPTEMDLQEYDGIIVGSGVKYGRWTKEGLNFLKKFKFLLERKPLGIFVSSGEASNPRTYEKAKEKYLTDVLSKIGIDVNNTMIEAFGGVFDLSVDSSYNFLERKILKRIAESDNTGFIIHDGKLNDFRNWQSIRNWATDFCIKVQSQS